MKKIYFYLPLILFFIIGCEKEELVDLHEESSDISTVTPEEASGIIDKISLGKGTNNGKLTILYNEIYFEPVVNSNEKFTVIPVIFPKDGVDSKILMLKINDKVNYVLFSMIPDSPLIDHKDFDGKIMINNLNGKFINGFRVENGIIISGFVYKTINKCESDYWEGYDLGCDQTLDEVIITTPNEDPYIPINYIYPDSGGNEDDSYYYNFQPDGGGSSGGDESLIVFTETLEKNEVIEEDKDNPLFKVNCATFEYYKPPGSSVTAAAVDNMHEYFYSAEVMRDGRTRFNEISVKYNRIYFTMPSWRRNGEAANMTAEAVTNAVNATQAWYLLNPSASTTTVSDRLIQFMHASMISIGGQFSKVAPFPMRNGGEYQRSLLTSGNCD